jgi:hypothetical protein
MKKEVNRLPTTQQALRCFQLCQNLTNLSLSVDLVRLDQRTGHVIILSGEEILIEIYQKVNWRLINEV